MALDSLDGSGEEDLRLAPSDQVHLKEDGQARESY